jgi:hypothetical protein
MMEFEGLEPKVVTLEDVVNKPEWDSADVEFLVMHEHMLDEETLAKLGITEPVPMTPAEVQKETDLIKKAKRPVAKKTE